MGSFLDTSNFLNTYYALHIAVEQHIADMCLNGDLNRIIYSSREYAFRERVRQRENGGTTNPNKDKTASLDLPFAYLKLDTITPKTDRKLWNNLANIEGLYDSTLGIKYRVIPCNISFTGGILYSSLEDTLYAHSKIMSDESNETILYPELTFTNSDGDEVTDSISAFLGYGNIEIDGSGYEETDWLTKNRMHHINLDGLNFDTVILSTEGAEDVYLTEQFILNFLSTKDGYSGDLDDIDTLDPQELLTFYFDENGSLSEEEATEDE